MQNCSKSTVGDLFYRRPPEGTYPHLVVEKSDTIRARIVTDEVELWSSDCYNWDELDEMKDELTPACLYYRIDLKGFYEVF